MTLASAEHSLNVAALRLVIQSSLFVLIVLGVVTLFRMLKRNATTDGYKRGCDMIRQLFKDHFDDAQILLHYHPFAPARVEARQANEFRKIGGLTHTVAAINSVLVAGFAGAVLYPNPGESRTYIGSAAAFFFALTLQFSYVNRRERKSRKSLRASGPTHAGGIVFRVRDNTVEYLLVGPKKEKQHEWLLPKGHIEIEEGHGEAALREVREETGVVASLICFVGRIEFEVPREQVRAKYYLMEALYETAPAESRRVKWFAFTDSCQQLTHYSDKYLIAAAEKKRAALAAT